MKYLMIAILSAGVLQSASGDEVRLTNDRTLVGVAREESDRVIVEMNFGTVTLPRSDVRSITPGRTLLQDYEERLAGLGNCPDAPQTFELALWARDQGLSRYVQELLNRTIVLNPDHEQARALLGYESYQGKWMRGAELKKAQGWVEVQGRWVPPTEPDDFCNPEPAAPAVVHPAKRKAAEPEGVPYTLGFPAYNTNKGTRNTGYGGYSLWGGVNPTNNLLDLPINRSRTSSPVRGNATPAR